MQSVNYHLLYNACYDCVKAMLINIEIKCNATPATNSSQGKVKIHTALPLSRS